jgi:hypothetical protein
MVLILRAQDAPYYMGIFHENPYITENVPIEESEDISFTIWNGFTDVSEFDVPFFGDTLISLFHSSGTWNGLGVTSQIPLDFTAYNEGYLHLALKVDALSEADFRIAFKDQDNKEFMLNFVAGDGLYGFNRDNEWYELLLPIPDFRERVGGVMTDNMANITNFEDMRNPYMFLGDVTAAMDEIWWSIVTDIPSSVKKTNMHVIRAYPNPVTNTLYLDGDFNFEGARVFDMSGRQVMEINQSGLRQLDVTTLGQGYYIVHALTDEGQTYKMRFFRN